MAQILKELGEYRKFTGPMEADKAISTLHGIVKGIEMDARVNMEEIDELLFWCSAHKHLKRYSPFDEIIPLVEQCISDGALTSEEQSDILYACEKASQTGGYFDVLTISLQQLQGILHGILADGTLNDEEIIALSDWLNEYDFLSGYYPYDEINSLVVTALSDGKISEDERNMLIAFFSMFVDTSVSSNLHETDLASFRKQYCVEGICALCPEIMFDGKQFCFTGASHKAERKEIAKMVIDAGGFFTNDINNKTDYLIIGNAGNPCWAFSCYGRKVEKAVNLRKQGKPLIIVNENDFWDALADQE